MIIIEYATKFEELAKISPHYNIATAEGSKCIKFESSLRLEIKQGIKYQEIHQFVVLWDKCRIYDEDYKARFPHYKSLSVKKEKGQFRGKSYVTPTD